MNCAAEIMRNGMPDCAGKRIIAIHQPNFAPWAGFFHKMMASDCFVYLDTAAYTKNGFQNRNRIRVGSEIRWLTVPVLVKGCFNAPSKDIRVNNQIPWRKKHLAFLQSRFGRAAFFAEIMALIESAYTENWQFLIDFNIAVLDRIRVYLGMKTSIVLASDFPSEHVASERLVFLTKNLGGQVYLSGASGRDYLDESNFGENGIEVRYQEFKPEPLIDSDGYDCSKLSILEVLFLLGGNTTGWLLGGGKWEERR